MSTRPSTPPPPPRPTIPLTPEQVRRIEENRLKAKALRARQEATEAPVDRTPSGYVVGRKRGFDAVDSGDVRDGRIGGVNQMRGPAGRASVGPAGNTPAGANNISPTGANGGSTGAAPARPHDDITAARKFTKYVEYDFSKMTDTKGGFLTAEDDPHNRALHASTNPEDQKPAHMTMKEWERHRLLKKLREQRQGPFEPGLSSLSRTAGDDTKKTPQVCRECSSLEIDWKWEEVFHCLICNACKDRLPEKYSLLTKTEAREDYLLTDPELKDPDLLPHLERPNPHKATWNNMQLYLRYQVEEYAFSERKWGSQEKMDAEFERREADKKKRKEDKFRGKLEELKKRTRVEAFRRGKEAARAAGRKSGGGGGAGGDEAQFGDRIGRALGERHEHEWGRTLVDANGVGVKKCGECGLEVEEIEF